MESIYHKSVAGTACKATARRWPRLLPALVIAFSAASLNFLGPCANTVWDGLHSRPAHLAGPCDFVGFQAAGRMAATGRAGAVYQTGPMFAQEARAPADGLQIPFLYPPTGLLLPLLVQRLPFFAGLALWTLGLTLGAALLLRAAGLPWAVVALCGLSPAALLNAGLGQFGLLLAALSLASLARLHRHPGAAGVSMAVMAAIKPQAALLLPVLLAAGRHWRALACAAAGGAGLCGLSVALFGLACWRGFLGQGLAVAHFILVQPFPSGPLPALSSYELYGTSVIWMLRSFGFGLATAAVGQAGVTVGAALLCWRLWRTDAGEPAARLALTLCLAILAAPYGFSYDLCGVVAATTALAWRERRMHVADALLWVWPMLGLVIAMRFRLELTPLVLAAVAWRAHRARRRGVPRARATHTDQVLHRRSAPGFDAVR